MVQWSQHGESPDWWYDAWAHAKLTTRPWWQEPLVVGLVLWGAALIVALTGVGQ